ncbi:MAG: type 1 glutamine amidotransferase domain-containing protein [Pseudomonadota bacterium]
MNKMFGAPSRHILIILSDPATSPVTGWPIGFWWAELTHAWLAFRDAGYQMTICSPNGGDLMGDIWSDPEHETGYAAWDIVSQGFIKGPQTKDLIKGVPTLGSLNMDDYDALYLAGGQGPMVTWIDNTELQRTVAAFYESGKITCAVCHGTCILLNTTLSNGDLLVKGKTWTGFANTEEEFSESAAGQKIQPFWIENEARKIEQTNFIVDSMQSEFAVRDGNLVTGQQNFSGKAAAEKMIEALGS